jgi:hypothetical protein
MKFLIFKIFLLITLICFHKADIPVHCKKSQVIGKWTFNATNPEKKTIQDLYNHKCGHEMPSNENSSHLSLKYLNVEKFDRTFEVEFTTNEAISNSKVLFIFI